MLRKGYKTEKIEQNGTKEWNETLEEWCYLLPLTKVCEKEIHRRCEEEVVSAEMAIRKKKETAKPSAVSNAAGGSHQEADCLVDLLSESDAEEQTGSLPKEETEKQRRQREKRDAKKAEKAEKAEKDKEKKAAAEEARKAKRATIAANRKVVKLATGCVTSLSDCVTDVGKALQSKAADPSLDDALKASATESLTTLKDWKHACAQALAQHGKNVETPLTLPFDSNKEVADKIKEAKTLKDSILGKKRKGVQQ